jgi:N-acetylglucosaminyldiphosphoundecaprenol N-acetyl-beta-D-mannosaminyltransferase
LEKVREALLASRPDVVYVGLGFPKQERLIADLRNGLPYTWFVSCGISFSFVAGEITRAPAVMQRLGLEWLHRMTQEPRRLYRRYLLQGIPFMLQLMSSALVFRLRHAARGAP